MVNISLTSTGLIRVNKQRRQRSTRSTLIKRRPSFMTRARAAAEAQQQREREEKEEQANKENDPTSEGSTVPPGSIGTFTCGIPAYGSSWVVARDSQGCPFWLNTATGQQAHGMMNHTGPAGFMQQQFPAPPSMAPPMMHFPQPPPQGRHFATQEVALPLQTQAQGPSQAMVSTAMAAGTGGYVLSRVGHQPATTNDDAPQEESGEGKRAVLAPVSQMKTSGVNRPEGEGATGANKESKVSWPKPSWEECYDDKGKPVWIHTVSKKLVRSDPYK